MIDAIPTPGAAEPICDNVALNAADWLKTLNEEGRTGNAESTYLSFDPETSLRMVPFFDDLVTSPTGLCNGVAFMTKSEPVSDLAAFIGRLITLHDDDIKLLYMVQRFEHPEYIDFDKPPLTYSVRYAILKR